MERVYKVKSSNYWITFTIKTHMDIWHTKELFLKTGYQILCRALIVKVIYCFLSVIVRPFFFKL